jgi:hypothetical protein
VGVVTPLESTGQRSTGRFVGQPRTGDLALADEAKRRRQSQRRQLQRPVARPTSGPQKPPPTAQTK